MCLFKNKTLEVILLVKSGKILVHYMTPIIDYNFIILSLIGYSYRRSLCHIYMFIFWVLNLIKKKSWWHGHVNLSSTKTIFLVGFFVVFVFQCYVNLKKSFMHEALKSQVAW